MNCHYHCFALTQLLNVFRKMYLNSILRVFIKPLSKPSNDPSHRYACYIYVCVLILCIGVFIILILLCCFFSDARRTDRPEIYCVSPQGPF